jgi:hypothetical protein
MIYGALDLAKQSGVAWGKPGGRPEFDTWQLGGAALQRGKRGLALMGFLVEWLADVKPDLVFIEGPMNSGGQANAGSTLDTTIALQGYILIAEMVCFSRGVPTKLLDRQDVLGHFTGRRTYKQKGMGKKMCMMRACQFGWRPENEDEADAGAMWHFGCAEEDRAAYLKRVGAEPAKTTRGKLL